ncbi:MAG: hypothetical protein RLO50_14500 [Azospirillaceae bacterium]
MATALDRLEVQITANAQRFEQSMRGAQQSMDRFGRQVDQRMSRIHRSFDGAGAALRRFIAPLSLAVFVQGARRAVEFADAMDVASRRIGVTAEQLQEFRFAAEDAANITAGQADTALQRFTRRVGEAAQGTGELRQVLEAYGIAIRNADGSMRPIMAVLRDYADATANAGSTQEQLRLAVRAFDSEGAALVNVLARGSEGMDEFARAAREAGILTNEQVDEMAALDAEVTRLSTSLNTDLAQAFVDLAPIISAFVQTIRTASSYLSEFWTIVEGGRNAGGVRELAAENLMMTYNNLERAVQERQGTDEAAEAFRLAMTQYNRAYGTNLTSAADALNAINAFATLPEGMEGFSLPAAPTPIDIPMPGGSSGGGGSSTADRDRGAEFVNRLEYEIDLIRQRAEALQELDPTLQRVAELEAEWMSRLAMQGELTDAARAAIPELAAEMVALNEQLERAEEVQTLVNEALAAGVDGTELYNEALAILQARYDAGTISAEQFAAAQEHINGLGAEIPSWANEAGGAITDAFSDLVSGSVSAEDALARLAQRLADMIVEITILQPLAQALSQTLSGLGSGGGGGFGGFLSSLFGGGGKVPTFSGPGIAKFGGFKASGGPVDPSRWYMVGERGPEAFVPNVPGRIIPAGSERAGAGGGSINAPITVNIDATGADAAGLARVERRLDGLTRELPSLIVQTTAAAQRNRRMR